MRNIDFWITFGVMILVLVVVMAIKCIPKNKLPYCLGGTKEAEKFTCPLKYIEWCNANGLDAVIPQELVADMEKERACKDTIAENIKRGRKPEGYTPKFRW